VGTEYAIDEYGTVPWEQFLTYPAPLCHLLESQSFHGSV
jgi:hypothetical protein